MQIMSYLITRAMVSYTGSKSIKSRIFFSFLYLFVAFNTWLMQPRSEILVAVKKTFRTLESSICLRVEISRVGKWLSHRESAGVFHKAHFLLKQEIMEMQLKQYRGRLL